jgi:uncharacterized surface protein with fasciclin (FAS1) repeats
LAQQMFCENQMFPYPLINKNLKMKFKKHRIIKIALFFFAAAFVFSSCKKDDEATAVPTQTLDQLISANADLSVFNAALARTNLSIFTKGGGPFTIIAPTNAAFAAAGIANEAALASLDSNQLVQILTYHIQGGARSFTEFPLGPNATMTTQGGFTQYGSRFVGGSIYINGGMVSGFGTAGSNGNLYVIDKLLIPPFLSITASLAANPNYSLMALAISKTAVTITGSPITVFAVPNSAMSAAGYDATTINNLVAASPAYLTLQSIMRYHIVTQRIFTPDFKTGSLKTAQGTNLTITAGNPVQVKGTNNPVPFQITGGDILTTNGVIQPINGLLKP